MTNITVIWTFPKKPGLISKAVKWFLGRNYDHVAMIYTTEYGKRFVFETGSKHGTITIPIEAVELEKNIIKTKWVELKCEPQRLYGFIDGMQGKPYSRILQPLTAVMYRLGLPFRFFNGNAKSWCSETIAQVLYNYAHINFDKKFDLILPTDIEDTLDKV